MKEIEKFENRSDRSITLQMRLIPVGETAKNFKEKKMLEEEQLRLESYNKLKPILDDYLRKIIDETLDGKKDKVGKDPAFLKLVDTMKKEKNSELRSLMKNYKKTIKEWFSIKFDGKFLNKVRDSLNQEDDNRALFDIFKGFSCYFDQYNKARTNIFSEKDSVSVAYRIINDNLPKCLANSRKWEKIKAGYPGLYQQIDAIRETFHLSSIDQLFLPKDYPRYFSQKGIELYNQVLSGIAAAPGEKKTQGINELVNRFCQDNKEIRKRDLLMEPLYKQILSDRSESETFFPVIRNDEELLAETEKVLKNKEWLEESVELLQSIETLDLSKVYITKKEVSSISNFLYSDWEVLRTALLAYLDEKIPESGKRMSASRKQKEFEKEMARKFFSIGELQESIDFSGTGNDVAVGKRNISEYYTSNSKKYYSEFCENADRLEKYISDSKAKKSNKAFVETLKGALDASLALVNLLRSFVFPEGKEIETDFSEAIHAKDKDVSESLFTYNKVRNYIAKKISGEQRLRLFFGSSTVGAGWSQDKNGYEQYRSSIFMREGCYYLGIMVKTFNFSDLEASDGEEAFEKMVYSQIPDIGKDFPRLVLPKLSTLVPETPKEIVNCISRRNEKNKTFWLPDFETQDDFNEALIPYYIKAFPEYAKGDWKKYGIKFKDPHQYGSYSELTQEINRKAYSITFKRISVKRIEEKIQEGSFFLFKIYNKDFAEGARGTKNLHTLYFEQLFSPENLQDPVIRLNGGAHFYFRPKKEETPIVHKADSLLLNRNMADGTRLPDSVYQELLGNINGRSSDSSLSSEAQIAKKKVGIKKAKIDLTKDRRFYEDQFQLSIPITFMGQPSSEKDLNELVWDSIRRKTEFNIIGIDRGERNLVYISVINQDGKIVCQRALDTVVSDSGMTVNYQSKLVEATKARDEARRSWSSIGQIKDLKAGYLSFVVHEIAKLMVEFDSIVVLEKLNPGFKNSRICVEQQVYQKFEEALITKLNYLVFKNKDAAKREAGSVLNGLQLTNPIKTLSDIGNQTGWLFYVPAAYTSKVDPTTGFTNLFRFRDMTNYKKKWDFFSKFKELVYSPQEVDFKFTFDYSDFECSVKMPKGSVWEVSSRGYRIVYDKKKRTNEKIDLTQSIMSLLKEFEISFENGSDILPSLLSKNEDKQVYQLFDQLFRLFKALVQLRNSDSKEDFIISPVKNKDGFYFNSNDFDASSSLPCDADANGAYNIARKGLILVRRIKEWDPKANPYPDMKIEDKTWFDFISDRNPGIDGGTIS